VTGGTLPRVASSTLALDSWECPLTDVSAALGTDVVGIAQEFGEQERDDLARTRAFVDDEVLPVINGFWERAEFPVSLVRRTGELGLVSDGIDYPGVPPMSPASAGLVAIEPSRGDGSLATSAGVQAGSTPAARSTTPSPRWPSSTTRARPGRSACRHGTCSAATASCWRTT
jgi:hypothetical protein